MNAVEIVEKVLSFYADPENNYGYINTYPHLVYYHDDHTKCAIGCLLEDPKSVQSFVDGNGYGVYSITALQAHASHTNAEVAAQIQTIMPTDIRSARKFHFLIDVQKAHDRLAPNCLEYSKQDLWYDLRQQLVNVLKEYQVNQDDIDRISRSDCPLLSNTGE